jgi:hypothetical protein
MFGGGWTTRAPLVDVVQCVIRSNRRATLEATLMRGEHRAPKKATRSRGQRGAAQLFWGVQRNRRANLSPETKIRFTLKERSSMSRSLTYYAERPIK